MRISNLMTRVLTLALMLFASNSLAATTKCSKCTELDPETSCAASIVQLMMSPSSYESKEVRLAGVVHFEHERNLLYIDRYSYKEGVYENAINLAVGVEDIKPLTRVNGEVVRIYGRFQKLNDGHYYLAKISHIKLKEGGLILFDDSSGKVIPTIINKAK